MQLSFRRALSLLLLISLATALSGCGAAAFEVVPTTRPTATATPTETPSPTLDRSAVPTATLTPPPATGGPSPTPLFGQPVTAAVSPTRALLNPNAPRIEFFTADGAAVAPGNIVTLYWSTRNASDAVIYQMDRGERSRLWNVPPDGSLPVQTRASDRGVLDFVLSIGDGVQRVEQPLSIPLACPDVWFFNPAPSDCPTRPAEETFIIEQPFERGRMIYVQAVDRVYALFNDGFDPAWLVLDNRFDPAIHPGSEPGFPVPPGYFQPTNELGFVWRGNDLVRNRLGLGAQPESRFNGLIQRAAARDGAETLYLSSAEGSVLRLLPGGDAWEIIALP
ncbi:MAG: hypothetical protein JNL42_06425 [Anaerolineae bacterium]|nr:hypothetical protein [Anaerolineae bacterium]